MNLLHNDTFHNFLSVLSDTIRQVSIDYSEKSNYNLDRTNVRYRYHEGGFKMLSMNEEELLRMIRENDNPEQAVMTAIDTILEYLRQHGSSEGQAVVYPLEPI